jgi:hypothetical protein
MLPCAGHTGVVDGAREADADRETVTLKPRVGDGDVLAITECDADGDDEGKTEGDGVADKHGVAFTFGAQMARTKSTVCIT